MQLAFWFAAADMEPVDLLIFWPANSSTLLEQIKSPVTAA
jgi:hypothetical protein